MTARPRQARSDRRRLLLVHRNAVAFGHDHLPLVNVWGPKQVQSFGVVTRDYKYIWWPYASGSFEATEELYHLAEDPLELRNLASRPEHEEALSALRSTYDRAVSAWQDEAVPYHNYRDYGRIFSRSYTWTP